VAATDDQEQGLEGEGTGQMDQSNGVHVVLLKYYPDCTIHVSQYNYITNNIGDR